MQKKDQRQSTTDRVREALRQKILSGELPPGARLREMEIARAFDSSQAPVREALKELEARDLVVTEAYRGTYVREITQRDMIEAYHVRAALEELAGDHAAAALKGRKAQMQAILDGAAAVAAEQSPQEYARVDFEFHRLIVQAAGNRLLLRSWDALAFETRIEVLLRRVNIDFNRSIEEHGHIVEALEKGRGKTAGRLLCEHSMRFAGLLEQGDRREL